MHKYQMSVHHFFEGRKSFTIEADNKKEAIEKGLLYVRQNPMYGGGNYDLNDVKCDKKLRK